MSRVKQIGVFIALISFFLVFFLFNPVPEHPEVGKTAAITVLMVILWLTEAIPLAATSLIPLILFPILGIISGKDISAAYINSTIFLFLGGFMLAIAMEQWGLHKRIALKIISLFGGSPNSILFGFMISSGFLSMWISNTATAVMMLPIALSVISKMEAEFGEEKSKNFSKAILLGIAYSCSIGGIGTLVGTPPNLALVRIFNITFPEAPEISFGTWMILAVPISIIMLLVTAILLSKFLFKIDKDVHLKKNFIKNEYKELGEMRFSEKVIASVFSITSLLWIFRADFDFGSLKIPGWSNILPNADYIDDGTIAITMALLLFFIPSRTEKGVILNKETFQKIPWGVILLFGGGFALAKAFTASGLSDYLGNSLSLLSSLSPFFLLLILNFAVIFLTEITSNTALTQMLMPILAAVGVHLGINPLMLMMSAAISASMAFMMPVGTPPNTIVFASNKIQISDMAKAGFFLNLLSTLIITLMIYYLGFVLFDFGTFPAWATGK
ncbi:MAG: sodium:dicarboxylate symporter [Ignavibacteria bacterium GWF2_33_9]|nr:MAG: sodium:dicarboxylate symporter [Ignavibacteria bacterium GWF2_33_9]